MKQLNYIVASKGIFSKISSIHAVVSKNEFNIHVLFLVLVLLGSCFRSTFLVFFMRVVGAHAYTSQRKSPAPNTWPSVTALH